MDELLDTAPCGYLSFADDGSIATVNATLLGMLRYDRAEVIGSHVETLLSTPGRIFYQTHFFPLLRLAGRADEIFLTLTSRSGEALPVLVNAVRRERAGKMLNECVLIPLRQRQKWEEEIIRAKRLAEEANRVKASFLSMMSHDLRTPLNAISGYADLIMMGIRGPVTDDQLQDLGRIKHASQFLLSLLNDVLSFARLEAGQLDIRVTAVSVEDALRQAELLVQPQLAAAGLAYDRHDCETGVLVEADGERLQQILLNLLTNAVKFTPSGGSISVGCELSHRQVRICVRDTGPGVPPEQQQRIFEPFVQLGTGGSAATKLGVGLGLAISRQLARAMGGDLTLEPTAHGGATFCVALPRVDGSSS